MTKSMIGYHYTSFANWLNIQRDGLLPYWIDHPQVVRLAGAIHGIFVWSNRPDELAHVGNIIFQIGSKASLHIVRLRLEYEDQDEWTSRQGERVRLHHSAVVTTTRGGVSSPGLAYHRSEPTVILKNAVPINRIVLEGHWNLMELLCDWKLFTY